MTSVQTLQYGFGADPASSRTTYEKSVGGIGSDIERDNAYCG